MPFTSAAADIALLRLASATGRAPTPVASAPMAPTARARLQRLAAELEESGLAATDRPEPFRQLLVDEVDQALRPQAHERRVASAGALLQPRSDPATWAAGAEVG